MPPREKHTDQVVSDAIDESDILKQGLKLIAGKFVGE
jgi:hypothetical protein